MGLTAGPGFGLSIPAEGTDVRCDVAVIGSGPAGLYCACSCAAAGLRTVLVERDRLGGTGFRWGCLPVKIVLDAQRAREGRGGRLGPAGVPRLLRHRLPEIESRLARRLHRAGVQLLEGQAVFRGGGGHELQVGDRVLEAGAVVVATGGEPADWPGVRLDHRRVLSHRDLVGLPRLPSRLLVLGADVEGIELACLLAHAGVRVTVIEKQPEALPGQDRDLAAPVIDGLLARGTQLLTGAEVTGSEEGPRGVRLHLADGRRLSAPSVLLTGLRRPNLPRGLEAAGVRLGPGGSSVEVDENLQSSCPGVYAIGDVNGLSGMAHAAIEQALRVASRLAGREAPAGAQDAPARALFTLPEIAGAGLQERELAARGIRCDVQRVELADTWRGLASPEAQGFAKLLSGPDGRVLGLWLCAPRASEMAAWFGLLLDRGLGVGDLLHGLPIHPTLAEALLEAALGSEPAPRSGPAPAGPGPRRPQDRP